MTATAFKLRCADFSSLKFEAVADYDAGDMEQVEDRIGVIVEDTDSGDDAVMVYRAEAIVVPKAITSGVTFSKGEKVYFDASEDNVTNESSGNIYIGTANEDVSTSTTATVEIDLKGDNSEVS